jgi:hypothetical protein
MAINKQTVNLYWVSTDDHDSDWFIFATTARQALAFHERAEGLRGPYGDDASSRLIVSRVTLEKFENGTPPCHARFEDLYQIGLEAGTNPGRRKRRFNGEIFQNGILEAIIELGRQRRALENGCVPAEREPSSTVMPKVERGPQLVY